MTELLKLEDIGVRLGGRQVLANVNFAIKPGEFTGLIGPNGAGKTTLLKVILGLQAPTAGTVLIDGRNGRAGRTGRARGNGRRNRRAGSNQREIGYVPQKLVIDPDMPLRARDVVSLGIDGHKLGFSLPSRQRASRVEQALRDVGADGYADARVGELSGGEQQRVLIAHAMISRPKLLLLDEPLANLDLRSEQAIVGLLARLAREQDIAVLISAHDMNPLLPVTDRIVYLAAGRAVSGSADEVVTSEVLSRLYGQQVEVIRLRNRVVVLADADRCADADAEAGGTGAAYALHIRAGPAVE